MQTWYGKHCTLILSLSRNNFLSTRQLTTDQRAWTYSVIESWHVVTKKRNKANKDSIKNEVTMVALRSQLLNLFQRWSTNKTASNWKKLTVNIKTFPPRTFFNRNMPHSTFISRNMACPFVLMTYEFYIGRTWPFK